MKLIHIQTGQDLFDDPIFQKTMSEFGVIIPKDLRPQFNHKPRVYWDDPEFISAFKEFYFNREMDPKLYEWR
jgi:hypothetical protein